MNKFYELVIALAFFGMIIITLVLGCCSLILNTWFWHISFAISLLGLIANTLYMMFKD